MKLFKLNVVVVAIFLMTSLVSSQNNFYKKVIHNTDPEAKCLDGSPAFFYIHQGTEKDKFLLYFVGGGFCGETTLSASLQSCYKRSKTQLGGSGSWPDTFTDSMGAQGLISLNETLYSNWTKVLFGYCDGSLHQGGNDSPIQYKDTKLYFRGGRIVRSHLTYLVKQYQLDKASKVMLTGGSAGGIAATAWGNYVQSIIKNPSSLYIIPDSGIFLNSTTYGTNVPLIQQQISTLMKLAQANQKSPIPQCNAANPGQEWKCLFIEENHKFIKGKHLFINSQYDAWVINNILKIRCLQLGSSGQTLKNCTNDEINAIENYRTKYLNFINQNLKNKGWGMWTIACSQHVYQIYNQMYDSGSQKVPMKSGKTVKDAMAEFIFSDKSIWTFDNNGWPSNQGCAY